MIIILTVLLTAIVATLVFEVYASQRDKMEIDTYRQGLKDGVDIADANPKTWVTVPVDESLEEW